MFEDEYMEKLAYSGFAFLGKSRGADYCICYKCCLEVHWWNPTTDMEPIAVHDCHMHAKDCRACYQERNVDQFRPSDRGQCKIILKKAKATELEEELASHRAAEAELSDDPDDAVNIKMQDRRKVFFDSEGKEVPPSPVTDSPLTEDIVKDYKRRILDLRNEALELQRQEDYDNHYYDEVSFQLPYLEFLFPPPESTRIGAAQTLRYQCSQIRRCCVQVYYHNRKWETKPRCCTMTTGNF
jgi:hypothetical protein